MKPDLFEIVFNMAVEVVVDGVINVLRFVGAEVDAWAGRVWNRLVNR